MKSKIHELKLINKIDASKTIKNIKNSRILSALILVTIILLSSCSNDEEVTPEATTLIPDTNFEQALIDLGYDTNGLNGNILKSDAENVTELEIGYIEISDLTGINAFTNLEHLNCEGNYLSNLDISGLATLKSLVCDANDIESINFHEESLLEHISCNSNLLNSLNVSTSINLRYLDCGTNDLTELDLSLNTQLVTLVFSRNNLTEINLTNNLLITKLYGSRNQLDFINLSLNTNLETVSLHNNQLVGLNIKNGNNINITDFYAKVNPNLSCVEVDNPNLSSIIWESYVDPQVTFLVNCN